MRIDFRAAFGYDVKLASDEVSLICNDPSRTVQSDAEDADINTIVRRFGLTGEFPTGLRAPTIVDYDGIFDFQSAQNALIRAEEEFMAIPADLRARFRNNPQVFYEFALDPNNMDEMIKLGFAVDKTPVVVHNDPAPVIPPVV